MSNVQAPRQFYKKLISRRFIFNDQHPFLLRELNELEQKLVDLWIDFYNEANSKVKKTVSPSTLDKKFLKYLTELSYSSDLYDSQNKNGLLQFQNLFRASPDIYMMTAIRRCSGIRVNLTGVEKRFGFREIVAHHQRKHFIAGAFKGAKEKALPDFDDFTRYAEQGLYIPALGICAPMLTAMKPYASPFLRSEISIFYAYFFNIPRELTKEQMAWLLPDTNARLEDLIQRTELFRATSARKLQIDLPIFKLPNASIQDQAFEFICQASQMFLKIASLDLSLIAEMNEFFDAYYRPEKVKKRTGIAPPNKPFKTLLPRRSKLSNQDFIRLYKAAWKTTNPIGFDIERKVLIDPPSRARLIEIREIQSKIITDYGELNEVECMRRCVPTEVIFRPELLDTRIDFSFQQLLRAIENECWPNTESDISALADSTDGIIFTNNGRVQKLTESFENSALGVDGVPRAVARESIGKSEIGRVVKPNLIARAS